MTTAPVPQPAQEKKTVRRWWRFLPAYLRKIVVAVLTLLLVLVSSLFGRVVIFAATGNFLRRRFLPRTESDSIALLAGVVFWVALESLPYVWPFIIAGLIVVSLGLALTARYRMSWKKPRSVEP